MAGRTVCQTENGDDMELDTFLRAAPIAISSLQFTVVTLGFIVAFRAFAYTRASGQSAERAYVRAAMMDVIMKEYIERPFHERPEAPIDQDRPTRSLRAAKTVARRLVQDDPKVWSEMSTIYQQKHWQNNVAYATADALQQFGLAAFTATVPLRFALANVGDVVIDDWLICVDWVRSYQDKENVYKSQGRDTLSRIPYHRRHAEWIFLVAILWMKKEGWTYPDIYKKNPAILDDPQLERRLIYLTLADDEIIPLSARRDVEVLTGVKLPSRRQLAKQGGVHTP